MISRSARPSENLLEELQAALSHGTVARRVEALRRVTDLFVGNAVDYSDEHIRVFDDVFQCLIEQIETSARTLLADRLAPIAAAPPQIIRTLALDEVIEVSGPVLSKSERLDETTLIEIARTRGQAHLKAISLRRVLSDPAQPAGRKAEAARGLLHSSLSAETLGLVEDIVRLRWTSLADLYK